MGEQILVVAGGLCDAQAIAHLLSAASPFEARASRSIDDESVSLLVLDSTAVLQRELPSAIAQAALRGTPVILLISPDAPPLVTENALMAGALAVLPNTIPHEELAHEAELALRAVPHRSEFSRAAYARALGQQNIALSRRELEVIEALLSSPSETQADAAERLGMSLNTLKVHLANIRRKLGIRTSNPIALRAALEAAGW